MKLTWMVTIVVLISAGCTAPRSAATSFPDGEIVDLSHAYDSQAIFWPTAEAFRLDKVADGITPAGYYYAANNFFTSEHGGTHIDAPVHFAAGRESVDAIPLRRLVGRAVVIDVTAASAQNADYQVTVDDLMRWEQQHARIPSDAIVLLRTGFAQHWPDATRYLGTAERGDAAVAKLHFPGLHPDAAKWIVANRPIKAIGIDTASIDYGQSTLYESHRVLYERNIPAFENLASLDRLPPIGAHVVALPMKIRGGSGAPLRAIAFLPADTGPARASGEPDEPRSRESDAQPSRRRTECHARSRRHIIAVMSARVRRAVYDAVYERGAPPTIARLAATLDTAESTIRVALAELAAARVLVLQPSTGEILMTPPFSAVPTPFVVETSRHRSYANCAWDGFGVPIMLRDDAVLRTSCGCCGDAMTLQIDHCTPTTGQGIVHFAVPARRWWDDVVFT